MAIKDIRAALVEAYQSAGLGLTTAYENIDFQMPAKDTPWAAFFFRPNVPVGVEIGSNGRDEIRGFVQLDLNYGINQGTGAVFDAVTTLRNKFKPGVGFTKNGQEVIIRSCGPNFGRESNGWFRTSITINWYALLDR